MMDICIYRIDTNNCIKNKHRISSVTNFVNKRVTVTLLKNKCQCHFHFDNRKNWKPNGCDPERPQSRECPSTCLVEVNILPGIPQ